MILACHHISKEYPENIVLRDITFHLEKGDKAAVIGINGAGKTTLLRIITGLLKPDQGQILLEGTDITGAAPHERQMAMIFQEPALFPHTKVKDNIAYGMHRLGYTDEAIRQKTIDELNAPAEPDGQESAVATEEAPGETEIDVPVYLVI